MKKFIKNSKGAVTVFVTMLLIPAMLTCGTAVDLARLHTAKSIVQDANQLAANTVLSQYNALLYDLYGIFGVAKDDPILGELLDEYITVSIFGDKKTEKGLGTFQLFYGSNISFDEPEFAHGKDLRNTDVLKRQIEQYMKFRGPIIIVKEFLELVGASSFGSDVKVVGDKMEIEEAIAKILEKYRQLYDAIIAADKCDKIGGTAYAVGTVSSALEDIRLQFLSLARNFEKWKDSTTDAQKADCKLKHTAILVNIKNYILGGSIGRNWNSGGWNSSGTSQGLEKTIENQKISVDSFKIKFDKVIDIAKEIDAMKDELSKMIENFEARVNSGEINTELKDALTQKYGTPPKSILDSYKDILKWDDIESMSEKLKEGGIYYIDEILKPYLDKVIYRDRTNSSNPKYTREQLSNSASISQLKLLDDNEPIMEKLLKYSTDDVAYKMPPGFKKFGDYKGDNEEFFKELEALMNQPEVSLTKLFDEQKEKSGGDSEKSQRGMINQLRELVSKAYNGLKNNPLGAKSVNSAEQSISVGIENDFETVKSLNTNPVTNVISNPKRSLESVGDYLLLLTYSTEMFSNYSTGRPEINGRAKENLSDIKLPNSITSVPISPRVNYFFQSEVEYLYNGSENASDNLSAITKLIYTVRLICNFISVFSVSEVTTVVNSIKTAFSWNPPLGLILGELARGAFVAAESTIDVANLRNGDRIPLIKSGKSGQWVCSPSGVKKALEELNKEESSGKSKNTKGLSYLNYISFFFVAKGITDSKAADVLTKRVADLIELNALNYKESINCEESKMATVLNDAGRFKLEDMKTDFSITTKVDMRMLFLSMIFAQNFSDSKGKSMQTHFPIEVTDYRGY